MRLSKPAPPAAFSSLSAAESREILNAAAHLATGQQLLFELGWESGDFADMTDDCAVTLAVALLEKVQQKYFK